MGVVEFDGSWDWVLRGIENYSKYMFDCNNGNWLLRWLYEFLLKIMSNNIN